MNTVIVRFLTGTIPGVYPAIQYADGELTDTEALAYADRFVAAGGRTMISKSIVRDNITRAQADADYRSMVRCERRRGA
jgi:hypothetical protein